MRVTKYITAFMLVGNWAMAQSVENDYLVITFERERSWDVHQVEFSYWLLQVDSLADIRANLMPLYLKGFSSDNFKSCCLGDSLTMYYTSGTRFNFDQLYVQQVDELARIIKEDQKKIQIIRKRWPGGHKEIIHVYVTAITGSFCRCRLGRGGAKITEVSRVAIPKEQFKQTTDFWNSEHATKLKSYDFSTVQFLNFRSLL